MKARLAGAHAVSHMTAVSAASRPASAGVTMPLAAPKTSHGSVNAIVVAIKGLARYGEFTTGHQREQFLIGTLASLLWAGAGPAAVSRGRAL